MKKVVAVVVLIAGIAAAGYWQLQVRGRSRTNFNVAEVKRGQLESTVGSTGTLQPSETVDVGAQVVGRIIYIGKDANTKSGIVDWGSEVEGPEFDASGKIVKLGTILAQIDPSLYRAQKNSATASLQAAQADVKVKTATLFQATRDWDRAEKLYGTGGILQAEHDQYNATFQAATANLALSKANVALAEANLETAQTNLDYTTISAPVKGVVIDRRVNVGQTVVASLSAPSLFLIAKDLSKMDVWATVNEVDVGKIHAGQDVKFTVDAFPGRIYRGTVVPQGKLPFRLNATMNQNVVTYTVQVSVDNKDGLLRPYLTASMTFIVGQTEWFELTDKILASLAAEGVPESVVAKLKPVENKEFVSRADFLKALSERLTSEELQRFRDQVFNHAKKDALLVPNSALRWQPTRNQIRPDLRDGYFRLRGKKRAPGDTEATNRGFVWVKSEGGFVEYLEVQTGLSDSVHTEVLGVIGDGKLTEGTEIIIGEGVANDRSGGANPFVASPFKKKE
jgi:HlyD family secretion protein